MGNRLWEERLCVAPAWLPSLSGIPGCQVSASSLPCSFLLLIEQMKCHWEALLGMSPGWGPQRGCGRGTQTGFLAQLLEISSRLSGVIPSRIGGPGHKATSEERCPSSSVPDPQLEAALQSLESEQEVGSRRNQGKSRNKWRTAVPTSGLPA